MGCVRRTRLAVALDASDAECTDDEPDDDECACECACACEFSRKSARPRRNAERAGARSKREASACEMTRFDAVSSGGACRCAAEAEAEAEAANEAEADEDHDAVADGGPEAELFVAAAIK